MLTLFNLIRSQLTVTGIATVNIPQTGQRIAGSDYYPCLFSSNFQIPSFQSQVWFWNKVDWKAYTSGHTSISLSHFGPQNQSNVVSREPLTPAYNYSYCGHKGTYERVHTSLRRIVFGSEYFFQQLYQRFSDYDLKQCEPEGYCTFAALASWVLGCASVLFSVMWTHSIMTFEPLGVLWLAVFVQHARQSTASE